MHHLGLDLGFGEVKAVWRDSNGVIQYFDCPTIHVKAIQNPMMANENIITYAGKDYFVGEDARKEKAQVSPVDFKDILECTGLFCTFLKRRIGIAQEIVVIGSVPPMNWPERDRYKQQLENNFSEVGIVPQGMGAIQTVMDLIECESRVLVLDIGYNTVDHLLVDKGKSGAIQIRRGGTWPGAGVTSLAELFKSEIGDSGIRDLRFHTLKEFLKTGEAVYHGSKTDLSGAKRRAEETYRKGLSSRIREELSSEVQTLDAMVSCGGGIYYLDLEGLFGELPVIKPERPEYANALGQLILAETLNVLQGSDLGGDDEK